MLSHHEIVSQVEGHIERNERLVARLRELGVSYEDTIDAEVHFWADSQKGASDLGSELYRLGYRVLVLGPAADGSQRWNLEAGIRATLESVVSRETIELLVRLAAESGASYDGWGTSVKNRPEPS